MDPGLISLIISIAFLIFLIGFSIYTAFLIYSSFKGSPYVPTRRKFLTEILKASGIKKNMKFLELGCGDGRMVTEAVAGYDAIGYGVDVNPIVLQRARWLAKKRGAKRITFETKNLRDTSVHGYNIVYLFLLPELLAKYAPIWEKQAKKGTLFISHAFTIKRWEKFLEKKIPGKPYDTYFYKIS